MKSSLKKIYYLLNNEYRFKLIQLIILILVIALFEVLSIGTIIPFFSSIFLSDDFSRLFSVFKYFISFSNGELVKFSLILIFLVFFVKFLVNILFVYFQSSLSNDIRKNLAEKLYKSYLNIDYIYFLNTNVTDLIKNINVECDIFRYAFSQLIIALSEIIIFFFIIFFLFFFNPTFSFLIAFTIFLTFFIYNFFLKEYFKKLSYLRFTNSEKLFSLVSETIASLKEIKILGVKNHFIDNFNYSNSRLRKNLTLQEFFLGIPKSLIEFFGIIIIVSIISINLDSNLNILKVITHLGVYGLACFRLFPCLNRVIAGYNHIKLVDETINKLFISIKNSNINQQKVVDNPINIIEKALNIEKIRISEVSFSYKNKGTFNIGQINFEIEKNSFVGLIGSSGSGKSTLLNMIVGLVKPENGAIYYNDNLDIFYNLKHFYKKIAYVTQEVNIINDSVRNNIAFGLNSEEINNDKLLEVINYAQLDNFIKESEKGLDTVLGDKGSRLSGGQKQRIGIARALYFNPDFIVFDEATSALDSRTEEDFLKIIYNLKNKKTILFATHKNSILKRCDKIIRIYNGKIDILNYSEI